MSRILVTGGAGFIGSHLVVDLLSAGHDVRILDNFSTGHRRNLDEVIDDVELVEGDLRSYERVHHSVRGCEFVLHQGALPSVPRSIQDPLASSEINVGGTLNVVLAARDEEVRRVVFASSSSVYGDGPGFPRREDMAPRPLAPYAVSKLAAEQYCQVATRVYGVETVSLRYFNVFGARQDPFSEYSAVIPRFIRSLAAGEPPTIYGTGEQSRDFTHVANVVAGNLLAMVAPEAAGQVMNLACGEEQSLIALVGVLGELMAVDVEPRHEPARAGDVPRSVADISAARSLLGYEPQVAFREGLARTVDWFTSAAGQAASVG